MALSLGLRPGVVSRGYGRRGGAPLWVRGDSDPDEAGDEPVLIAQRTGVPVRVDANRERGVRALLAQGVELVISDDGLQRVQLPRALEICVLDGARRLGNGRMLPAGPLREPASRLAAVDYVVVHGEGAPGEHRMRLEAAHATRLDGSDERPAESLSETVLPIHAVAGIARPRRFFDTLAALGLKVVEHPFPDHHHYRPEDFANMDEQGIIVMTEKDAVKCRGFGLDNAWVLPVSAVLDEALERAWMADLQRIARKMTGNQHEP
ncbi:MAG: tetraacyldisaccharide 4'-kinase [Xanthomonadales bacterium]|nr:tetraacyldisaccharide 4'-kinase [Xanthomonadales bacterium]